MANANPAMSMKTVSVTYHKRKPLGTSGAYMSTFYNQTLKQADRAGMIRLDDHGKIAFVKPEVTINIPAGLFVEDVYTLDLLKDMDADILIPLTETGIAGIDEKIG